MTSEWPSPPAAPVTHEVYAQPGFIAPQAQAPSHPPSQAAYSPHPGHPSAAAFPLQQHPPQAFAAPLHGFAAPQQAFLPPQAFAPQQSFPPQQHGLAPHPGYAGPQSDFVPYQGHALPQQPPFSPRGFASQQQPPFSPQGFASQQQMYPPQNVAAMQQQMYPPQHVAPVQGYSQEPAGRSRLIEREPEQSTPLAYERRWDMGDDASRYEPPGSEEVDKDPFGLNALPKQTAYQGPRETPIDAYVSVAIGLLALALFPLVLIGLPRARRAKSMIEASPARYQGMAVATVGRSLNFVAPVTSLLLAAHFLMP